MNWLPVIAGVLVVAAILFRDVFLPGAPAIGAAGAELVDLVDDVEGDDRD